MVQRGPLSFQDLLCRRVVAMFSDNTTVVSYLGKQGGTFSLDLNEVSQQILRWSVCSGSEQCGSRCCLAPIR